ncbi:hypothetical protein E2542_SST07923 [Spatholobus suberectus]|nr:hypothetical protein E2542_SST07923 [Spatholobus suberectus]
MKRAAIPYLMWFVVILLHAYLSIADPAKTNDTTSVCDGSVHDCLIARHLDPEFPTITSSHFGRMLGEVPSKTDSSKDPNSAACRVQADRYFSCFPPKSNPNSADRCAERFNRDCMPK